MIFRQATEDDVDQLLTLTSHFLKGSPFGQYIRFNAEAAEQLIAMVLGLGVIFVAETEPDSRLVGMLALAAVPHLVSGDRYAEEQAWWVDPDYRKGTVGPKLLRLAETWTRQEGLIMLKMGAPAGSEVGTFYERLGFQAVETAYVKVIHDLHHVGAPRAGGLSGEPRHDPSPDDLASG